MHCPKMTIAYGQTETSPCITMSPGGGDLEKRTEIIGRPLPNTEVKIVALDGAAPAGKAASHKLA